METNEGEIGRVVRRDSPWWTDSDWANRDRDDLGNVAGSHTRVTISVEQ
jgi:hypothetical protein